MSQGDIGMSEKFDTNGDGLLEACNTVVLLVSGIDRQLSQLNPEVIETFSRSTKADFSGRGAGHGDFAVNDANGISIKRCEI